MREETHNEAKFDEFLSRTLTQALKKEFQFLIEARAFVLEHGTSLAAKSEVGGITFHTTKYYKGEDINVLDMANAISLQAQQMFSLRNEETSLPNLSVREELAARWRFEERKRSRKMPAEMLREAADEIIKKSKTGREIVKNLNALKFKKGTGYELV